MFELTPQNILATGMLMVGDLLVLTAVLIPAVVCIGIIATAIGRVSFRQVLGYWLLSLFLALVTGAGLIAKAGTDLAAEPNGLLFGFSDSLVLTLLGAAVFFLIASGGLLAYILSK